MTENKLVPESISALSTVEDSRALIKKRQELAARILDEVRPCEPQIESKAAYIMTSSLALRRANSTHEVEALHTDLCIKLGAKVSLGAYLGKKLPTHGQGVMLFDTTHDVGPNGKCWLRHIKDRQLFASDETRQAAIEWCDPFTWHDVRASMTPKARGQLIYIEAEKWGLFEGFVVPTATFGKGKGVVTLMGGEGFSSALSEAEKILLSSFVRDAFIKRTLLREDKALLPLPNLSEREREVVLLMLEGADTPEIAKKMGLQPNTVQQIFKKTFAKAGVSNRVQLVLSIWENDWRF